MSDVMKVYDIFVVRFHKVKNVSVSRHEHLKRVYDEKAAIGFLETCVEKGQSYTIREQPLEVALPPNGPETPLEKARRVQAQRTREEWREFIKEERRKILETLNDHPNFRWHYEAVADLHGMDKDRVSRQMKTLCEDDKKITVLKKGVYCALDSKVSRDAFDDVIFEAIHKYRDKVFHIEDIWNAIRSSPAAKGRVRDSVVNRLQAFVKEGYLTKPNLLTYTVDRETFLPGDADRVRVSFYKLSIEGGSEFIYGPEDKERALKLKEGFGEDATLVEYLSNGTKNVVQPEK